MPSMTVDSPYASSASSSTSHHVSFYQAGRLEGKNCVITGAAGGIGLETSILFVKEGANLIMSDVNETALLAAKATVKSHIPSHRIQSTRLEICLCDVSKEEQVENLVAQADAWGGVDVMFNNAGIMHGLDDDAVNTPEKVWDLTQNINVKGVLWGSKHAVLSMRRHGKRKGSVINTASFVAVMGAATPQLAYTASKGAVLAMTRELGIVHAREGYRFNSLCPGPLNTPLLQEWLGDDQAKRFKREVHFPSGRFGEAIEQAHGVVFLASDESSFVNATEFVIDGGLSKAYTTPDGPPSQAPLNNAFGR